MDILKKESAFVWVLLFFMTFGLSNILLAGYLKLFEKGAWYTKWQNWVLGGLCFVFPLVVMIIVFSVQMTVRVADKLKIGGNDLYTSPYFLITCFIIPLIGWTILLSIYFYLCLHIIIKLFQGEAENYI